MNQREREIKETETEIDNARKVSAVRLGALNREEMTMKLKQDENRDTEYYIEELNTTSSELRNRLLKLEESARLKHSELLALRKTVQHESNKLTNLRMQNRQMLVHEKEKEGIWKTTLEELRMIRERSEKFKNNTSNAQERLKQLEEMLECEKKNIKSIQDETVRLNSTLYHSEQQLKKLQSNEKYLLLETQALESGMMRTKASCKSLEKELLRQTEILYNVDYNIQNAEIRLANMRGTTDDVEETRKLESRHKRLEKTFEDKIRAEEMMKTQISRIEEDMRKLSNVYQSSIAESERIVSCRDD